MCIDASRQYSISVCEYQWTIYELSSGSRCVGLRACFKNQDWWFASLLDRRAIMVRIMASPCSGFRS